MVWSHEFLDSLNLFQTNVINIKCGRWNDLTKENAIFQAKFWLWPLKIFGWQLKSSKYLRAGWHSSHLVNPMHICCSFEDFGLTGLERHGYLLDLCKGMVHSCLHGISCSFTALFCACCTTSLVLLWGVAVCTEVCTVLLCVSTNMLWLYLFLWSCSLDEHKILFLQCAHNCKFLFVLNSEICKVQLMSIAALFLIRCFKNLIPSPKKMFSIVIHAS